MRIGGSIGEAMPLMSLFGAPSLTVKEVLDQLSQLAADGRTAGVLLEIENPEMGMAKIEELHAAIGQFRQAGKQAVAILGAEGLSGYLVASACDRIILAPSGLLLVAGLQAETFFFKDLLDKIGVQGDFLAMGKYKSAAEALTRSSWSEAAREATESLVSDLYEQMAMMIAAGRRMEPESVKNTIDLGPFTAEDALRYGLVDELAYEADFLLALEEKSGGAIRVRDVELREKPPLEEINPFNLLSLFGGAKPGKAAPSSKATKIAVIYAVGPILSIDPQDLLFPDGMAITPRQMSKHLKECLDDPSIRAIILRIDSPGGDATAADLIWRQTRQIRKQKPIVASMSDVAASGGYYIAMGADRVVAQPGTITGYIGVVGGKLVLGGLYEKLGISTQSASRGQNAGILSSTTAFSDSERAAFQRFLSAIYEEFVAKAAESRGMSAADLEAVAQGRVWTGRQAFKADLVDELGGMETALALAKELAGLPADRAVEIVVYPKQLGIIELMQKLLGAQAAATGPGAAAAIEGLLPAPLGRFTPFLPLFRQPRPLALMPYVFELR